MAYNNGFPISYPQFYPQYQQAVTPQQAQVQSNNSIIWVQGEAGAKSYLVAPNNTVQLWDSESQTIYLKSADASGMPSMRILDYTIRSEAPQGLSGALNPVKPIEISKADLDALQSQIDTLKDEVRACRQTINEGGIIHGEPDLRSDAK